MSGVEEFIESLRLERRRRRIKQGDLAEQLGVRREAVCNWERRACLPANENLQAWAAALGMAVPAGVRAARWRVAQHGTASGYERHLTLGDPACAACRQANADRQNAWRERRRAS